MKKVALVLAILLAVQTYGVIGAAQAKRIMYTCTMELGPLCYAWEENMVGKMLGPERAAELEGTLLDAREKFEKDFAEKLAKKEKGKQDLDALLEGVGEKAGEALDKAKELVEGAKKGD